MTTATANIAALLGSRICHDLVSPIGAISNGVELLQMSGTAGGPELELIFESVENANARIRFFRIAFGVASADQRIGISEIRDILKDLTRSTRMTVEWTSDDDLPRSDVKLAFLMIQCMEAALPWGGQISVEYRNNRWTISADSDRLKDIAPLWSTLCGDTDSPDISAAEIQFLLFPTMLADEGRSLYLDVGDTGVLARF